MFAAHTFGCSPGLGSMVGFLTHICSLLAPSLSLGVSAWGLSISKHSPTAGSWDSWA